MIFVLSPTQNPPKTLKNDPPSSMVALITPIRGGFLTFFMIFGGSSFFHENGVHVIFNENVNFH